MLDLELNQPHMTIFPGTHQLAFFFSLQCCMQCDQVGEAAYVERGHRPTLDLINRQLTCVETWGRFSLGFQRTCSNLRVSCGSSNCQRWQHVQGLMPIGNEGVCFLQITVLLGFKRECRRCGTSYPTFVVEQTSLVNVYHLFA